MTFSPTTTTNTNPNPNLNLTNTPTTTTTTTTNLNPTPKPSRLPRITPILPGLYLGNLPALQTPTLLHEHNITAIVSLTTSPWVQDPTLLLEIGIPSSHHKCLPVLDSLVQDLLRHMSEICEFIDEMACPELRACTTLPNTNKDVDEKAVVTGPAEPETNVSGEWGVLVHCDFGRSRSATIIIAYLMRKFKISVDEALGFVLARQKVKPNKSFLGQLGVWGEVGYEVWVGENDDDDDGNMYAFEDSDGEWERGKGNGKGKKVPKKAYGEYLLDRSERLWEMGFM
ncbi:phosphatases II [Aspergillus sclerotioniger CBS 115572]|uniref:protein-tyrosine-phosphatase n=1 Tax=Aspergillus sclerotioniger CBS 115572 TaxID=1450535 RepID=A0A317X8T7_9EURO|nr:phosphatases II [Aspergillus sclerotioniger CBS 115572]PWY95016.1 phosphatases II [Aspergillus sclerotioniger CBS 115572]